MMLPTPASSFFIFRLARYLHTSFTRLVFHLWKARGTVIWAPACYTWRIDTNGKQTTQHSPENHWPSTQWSQDVWLQATCIRKLWNKCQQQPMHRSCSYCWSDWWTVQWLRAIRKLRKWTEWISGAASQLYWWSPVAISRSTRHLAKISTKATARFVKSSIIWQFSFVIKHQPILHPYLHRPPVLSITISFYILFQWGSH